MSESVSLIPKQIEIEKTIAMKSIKLGHFTNSTNKSRKLLGDIQCKNSINLKQPENHEENNTYISLENCQVNQDHRVKVQPNLRSQRKDENSQNNPELTNAIENIKNDQATQMISSKLFEKKIIDLLTPMIVTKTSEIKLQMASIFETTIKTALENSLRKTNESMDLKITNSIKTFDNKLTDHIKTLSDVTDKKIDQVDKKINECSDEFESNVNKKISDCLQKNDFENSFKKISSEVEFCNLKFDEIEKDFDIWKGQTSKEMNQFSLEKERIFSRIKDNEEKFSVIKQNSNSLKEVLDKNNFCTEDCEKFKKKHEEISKKLDDTEKFKKNLEEISKNLELISIKSTVGFQEIEDIKKNSNRFEQSIKNIEKNSTAYNKSIDELKNIYEKQSKKLETTIEKCENLENLIQNTINKKYLYTDNFVKLRKSTEEKIEIKQESGKKSQEKKPNLKFKWHNKSKSSQDGSDKKNSGANLENSEEKRSKNHQSCFKNDSIMKTLTAKEAQSYLEKHFLDIKTKKSQQINDDSEFKDLDHILDPKSTDEKCNFSKKLRNNIVSLSVEHQKNVNQISPTNSDNQDESFSSADKFKENPDIIQTEFNKVRSELSAINMFEEDPNFVNFNIKTERSDSIAKNNFQENLIEITPSPQRELKLINERNEHFTQSGPGQLKRDFQQQNTDFDMLFDCNMNTSNNKKNLEENEMQGIDESRTSILSKNDPANTSCLSKKSFIKIKKGNLPITTTKLNQTNQLGSISMSNSIDDLDASPNNESSLEVEMILNDEGYLVDIHGNFIKDDEGNEVFLGDKEVEMLRVNGQLEEVFY